MPEPQSSSPPRRHRWFQYRLRTLLIAPIVMAFACYGYLDYRRVAKARVDYAQACTRYDCGVAMVTDLCPASKRLAEAEQRSYFIGSVRARSGHLLRVCEIEQAYRAKLEVTLFGEGGREEAGKMLDEIVRCRNDAMDWLREATGP